MPTFKGNAGHLMQHWPLCEMLEAAGQHTKGLNFIDAYAMAPLATENAGKDAKFQRAEDRLPNLGKAASAYERAWYKLTAGHHPPKGYPNSAAFVEQVWKGKFSMLLCEIDRATCQAIELWFQRVDNSDSRKAAELFCGDWRERFKKGLPRPADVRLEDDSLTLVLFDPNMCGHRDVGSNRWWNVYPKDIQLAMHSTKDIHGGILIQMSTYTANGDNPQGAVISSMNQILASNKFKLIAVVRIDGNMMSLVYARNVSWASELADILGGFDNWFSKI